MDRTDSSVVRVAAYRWTLAAIYGLGALAAGLLLWISMSRIDRDMLDIAHERASVLFRLIEMTRDWNAQHGGVYVPVTPTMQPNPYLVHPQRDVVTQDGQRLTLVNPALMTRQIAEIALAADGVRFHITSLKPIRPANAPDPWEAESLRRFESHGERERLEHLADGGGPMPGAVHRYMAPLLVKPACLRCHEHQGYRVGDVRGGISVTMPSRALEAMTHQRRWQAAAVILSALGLVVAMGHAIALRTRRHLVKLEAVNRGQETVIAARTDELRLANQALAQEVADLQTARRQLDMSRAQYQAVVDNIAEAIVVTDERHRILRVNPAFTAITGFSPDDVVGRHSGSLAADRHEPDFLATVEQQLAATGRWTGELWCRRRHSDAFVALVSVSTLPGEANSGRHVTTMVDITRRKLVEDELAYQATHDVLTGLPNRQLFDDRLAMALAAAQRRQASVAVVYLDLDHFKAVNDRLGHAAGDELLTQAAPRMAHCLREADTLARIGGDEFALLIVNPDPVDSVEAIVGRVLTALRHPFTLQDGEASISGSMGIALFPQHGHDAEALKRAADQALYQAKAAGRNQARTASSETMGG